MPSAVEEFFFEISCENETRKISISLRAALGLFIICMSGTWVCLCMCVKGGGVGESDNWTILVLDIVFKGIMRVCECDYISSS